MTVSQIMVYLDSYQSEPFISEITDMTNPFADQTSLEHWVRRKTGKPINLKEQMKVEDIRHCEKATNDSSISSTLVRISLVD